MGCGSSQNENQSEKIILLKKIKQKVFELIKDNPFYNITIKSFKKFMKEKLEKKEEKYSIEIISKEIIKEFFEEENMSNFIFKNIASFSYSKFHCIFPDDEEIKFLIFYFIFLFLVADQKERINLLNKKIKKLFDKIKLDERDGKILFRSGKFTFLLLNLIQFFTFTFIYFFCGPGILEVTGNFNKSEVEKIFSNQSKSKKYEPCNINKLLNDYLYFINNNIQPNIVNYIILTDVLQPISDYISENKEEVEFWIDSTKLKEIFDILIEKMNNNYYIELFFNNENALE